MATAAIQSHNTVSPLDALWALFQTQTKPVREAFTQRLLEAEDAKRKIQEARFKESFMRAVNEMREAERTGRKLQSAEELLEEMKSW